MITHTGNPSIGLGQVELESLLANQSSLSSEVWLTRTTLKITKWKPTEGSPVHLTEASSHS